MTEIKIEGRSSQASSLHNIGATTFSVKYVTKENADRIDGGVKKALNARPAFRGMNASSKSCSKSEKHEKAHNLDHDTWTAKEIKTAQIINKSQLTWIFMK